MSPQVPTFQVAEEKADGDGGRGMLAAVLREDSGELLLSRRFDTYLPGADKRNSLKFYPILQSFSPFSTASTRAASLF
jgi:hypothetical protein